MNSTAETSAGGTGVQAERTRAVDWDLVLSSLSYRRTAFENYRYPDQEIRQQRLAEVDNTIRQIREIKRGRNAC